MIIAFDNGYDGAGCAIHAESGGLISYIGMPTFTRKGKTEIDPLAVNDWLDEMGATVDTPIVIEEPLKHAKSSQSMRSMSISFGRLDAVVRLRGVVPYCMEVGDWQRPMLGKFKRGHSKIRALAVARQMEPSQNWHKNSRCRTPHDGVIDAYLIAQYYRRLRHEMNL